MKHLWEIIVRWRTYIANIVLAAFVVMPDLLNSPEIIAIVPAEYQRWVIVAGFILNIWMRPRPAVISSDPEVMISKAAGK